MDIITLYHNPRCSKSRKALEILQQAGVEPKIVAYLEQPLDESDLRALLGLLGDTEPMALVRTKEAEFAESGLAEGSDAEAVAAALARFPKLMERPVVVRGERALIARPPERARELL